MNELSSGEEILETRFLKFLFLKTNIFTPKLLCYRWDVNKRESPAH